MKRLAQLIKHPIIRNKYVITTLIFLIYLFYFTDSTPIDLYKNYKVKKSLEGQRQYYRDEIDKNKKKLMELKSNSKNLEDFARKEYLMKNDSEDVFLIVRQKE